MKSVATFSIIVLFVLLAACSPAPGVVTVPTLAALPTLTDTVPPPTQTPPTASSTPQDTATPTARPAAVAVVSTPTAPPSITPVPSETPTVTATPSHTPTPGPSLTPSQTITNTPTATLTATLVPTEDDDAITSLLALAMQATLLPPQIAQQIGSAPAPVIGVSCAYPAPPGFGDFFAADATFSAQIGCPVGAPPAALRLTGASQAYEHGVMIYVGDPQRSIYAIFADGHYRKFPDTWVDGVDPSSGGETPPSGLIEPIRGFGKVWRDHADVRAGLGWARTPEQGEDLSALQFDRGQVLSPPGLGHVYALADDGTGTGGVWRRT